MNLEVLYLKPPQQNSLQMNPPPQLLTPCAWTVHPPKGRAGLLAVALEVWGLGAVPPPDHGAWWVGQVVGCAIHGSGLMLMGQKRLAK